MKFVYVAALVAVLLVPVAQARVEVTIDAASLNDLVVKMAPSEVPVGLGAGRALNIGLNDLKITGFDPAGGKDGNGQVLASLRLTVAELGIDLPVAPRLSLQFREANGKKVAYLRFEEVKIALPITGAVDLATLLPLLPITTDTTWTVDSQRGDVSVTPRLTDATVGQRNLRLGFEVDVRPVAGAKAGGR